MKKVLIANRGEIARRVMRSCRELGLRTVAVYSEPDRDGMFVAEADEAAALGGSTPAESYLRIDAIIDAAKKTGADAIHPGYGFLSEDAEFARACAAAGITFIGPTPEAIAAMGSKIEAKKRMEAAGVPTLPSVNVNTQTAAALQTEVDKLGLPLLIKASAGGGGRGMRIVRTAAELAPALDAARQEAKSAFGDETVFIEPYVEISRHVEIQIFGDTHGNVVSLFERECSIQRRHQKILEESPSPVVDGAMRAEMGQAAVRGGQAIGYVGAGTVEFLVTPAGKFYFLEVNTRLQVEHPVTEEVTGLDLVRLQLLVAQGEPLPPDALEPRLQGHAIEVRLYAEDPRRDFLPVTGTLHDFDLSAGPPARVETGVEAGSAVSPFYDPMLAKVVVHAATRRQAAGQLAEKLRRMKLHGLRTNRELLVRLLEHPEFLSGQTDTHFLTRHSPAALGAPLADEAADGLHAVAAALALQAKRRAETTVLGAVPTGWRNSASQLQRDKFLSGERELAVGYRFSRERLHLELDGVELPAPRLLACSSSGVDLEIAGVRRRYEVHCVGDVCYVDSPLGASELTVVDPFPVPGMALAAGSLVASMPGLVAEVKVAVGDAVQQGDVLLVIESMKMLHPVTAPTAGTVSELRVAAAAQVEAGTVLAVIEEQTA